MAVLITAVAICASTTFCGSVIWYKFAQYEEAQNKEIDQLAEDVSSLKAEINRLTNLEDDAENLNTGFGYLAIGNSITWHGNADYWWNEIGMAASSADKDYVHRVVSYLQDKYGQVNYNAYNFYVWEVQAADRAETLQLLDEYLDEKLNLVTIQLGENVIDTETFETDYEELIRYIQQKAPEAQIIVVDEFWRDDNKSAQKVEAVNNTGVQFVNLDEIKEKAEYQCGIGTVVYDFYGGHTVEHEGVARHPGDKGMGYIADGIISKLR